MNNTHTTWHTEYERNLLIGSGMLSIHIYIHLLNKFHNE